MDENKSWVTLWKMIAVTFSVLMVSITGCTMHGNYLVEQMQVHGADPLIASCAILSGNNTTMCAIVASKQKAQQ